MAVQERRVQRMIFTTDVNALNDLLKKEPKNKEEINARFAKIELSYQRMTFLNDGILQDLLLLSDEGNPKGNDEEVAKELNRCGEYHLHYFMVRECYNEFLHNKKEIPIQIGMGQNSQDEFLAKNRIKLPKRELKKFNGDLGLWIGFWAQFSKIHDDESLAPEDKFDYLLQAMTPGSPAEKIIEGFPPSGENYPKAVELLKSRFGKDELLIEYYVRKLLALVLNKTEILSVAYLHDQLETQLRALETLDVTTDKYAAIIYPLVESSIPEHLFMIWDRHRISKKASTRNSKECLDELLVFLRIEVEGEARQQLRHASFEGGSNKVKESKTASKIRTESENNIPTAASLVASDRTREKKDSPCIFCGKHNHSPQDCAFAIDLSHDERTQVVMKKGACFRCLNRGHLSSACRSFAKCTNCKGKHYSIMCSNSERGISPSSNGNIPDQPVAMLAGTSYPHSTTYLQTLIAEVEMNGRSLLARVLCDSGSQRSYITKNFAKKLGLKRSGQLTVRQELFGGRKTSESIHNTYNITLKNLSSNFKFGLNVLDQDRICNFVPKLDNYNLYHVLRGKGVDLSDFTGNCDDVTDISVLLGSDAWARIISPEHLKVADDLVAVNTKLGWTLVGTHKERSTISSTLLVTLTCQTHLSHFWDLELMGINDPGMKISQKDKDKEVSEFFNRTVRREASGRYMVKLPWIYDYPTLDDNRETSRKRLLTTTRKLNQIDKFSDYDEVIQFWLNEGIVEYVNNDQSCGRRHYLPHRAVLKENSTTKIRPVFDASCKDRRGHSLNESLEKGPNLIESVPLILINFRKYVFGVSSDIEKAFLQILIDANDRDMLRFLWWEEGQMIELRHRRVVFGVTCSPYLLGAVLGHVIENAPSHLEETAQKLKGSFYVDNCLSGVSSEAEYIKFKKESQELLTTAGFNLRGWVSNIDFEEKVENILGLNWFCRTDELGCNGQQMVGVPTPITKRTILATAQRIFDPIGFTAPVSLTPKILLQKCWKLNIGWDEVLPADIGKEFSRWVKQLHYLNKCKIPRRIFLNETSSLHVFCDASKQAFATCIFLRTISDEKVVVNLVLAKSRVSPTKELTLPRLELMAALIGTRLSKLAKEGLNKIDIPTYYWSDSSVTLAWISMQGQWSVFVENRVREIRDGTLINQWYHVPGSRNPADLLSRGCCPKQLFESQWWEGPKWLCESESKWPKGNCSPIDEEVDSERRRSVISANVNILNDSLVSRLANRISKYSMIVRSLAWILRIPRRMSWKRKNPDITFEEYDEAEQLLFRCIQTEFFDQDALKILNNRIKTYTDEKLLIRMQSRILDEEATEEYTHPIVLPSQHLVVERLIEQQHVLNNHAGTLALMVILRERFWIVNGRRAIGRVVRKCVTCRKNQVKAMEAPTASLPTDRTKISATFQVTGTDLAGPLHVKGEKCWVVIFTCAVYRAVHLELIQSLSTGAYIQALRRFFARRGRVSVIYSDNGTNLVGTSNALDQINWKQVEQDCCIKKIKWKFNPPSAAWWGGFFERLIRILKDLLRKNLGHLSLSYEELNTLLCECEAIMNNRPLTYVSEDPSEFTPLKPSMFLMSLSGNETCDLDTVDTTSLVSRWRYLQKVRNGLRARFKKEYLGFLRSTQKKKKTGAVNVGGIVLIGSDDKKRLNWPLAKVIELFTGKDNVTRLVKLQTSRGIYIRPIQRLYPLEVHTDDNEEPIIQISESEDDDSEDSVESFQPTSTFTRSGRCVRPRNILDI